MTRRATMSRECTLAKPPLMSELPEMYHYSAEPLGELRPITVQEPREGSYWSFIDKPRGLWLSVEDVWEEWCRDVQFRVADCAVKTPIKILDSTRLLWLKTRHEVLDFADRYGERFALLDSNRMDGINWAAVAADYSGILICPYQHSLRLNEMWYYGWDCASGCIWDTSIIERVDQK